MKQSISSRIWMLSGTLLALVICYGIYSYVLERQRLLDNYSHQSQTAIRTVCADIAPGMWLHQQDFTNDALLEFAGRSGVTFLTLIGAGGVPLYEYNSGDFAALLGELRSSAIDRFDTRNTLLLREPVVYNGETQGYIVAGFDKYFLNREIEAARIRLAAALGTLLLIATLLTLRVRRSILRPLRKMTGHLEDAWQDGKPPRAADIMQNAPREMARLGEAVGTTLREMARELESSRSFHHYFETFFEASPVPVLVTLSSGKIDNANRAAAALFDRNLDELLDTSLEQLLSASEVFMIKRHLETSGKSLEGYITVIQSPGDVRRVVEINLAPLQDRSSGDRLIITMIDVTDKMEIQHEIVESQGRLAQQNRRLQEQTHSLEAAREKNEKYARKLIHLVKICQRLVRCNTVLEVLNILIDHGRQLLNCQEAIIFLWDPQKEQLVPVRSHNRKRLKELRPLEDGPGIVWQTYRADQPRFANNPSSQEYKDLCVSEKEQLCLIAVPVSSRGNAYGVVVYLQLYEHLFSAADIHLISALADQAAISLEKIHLLQAFKDRTANLETINDGLKRSRDQFSQSRKMESLGVLVGGIAHEFNNILGIINPNLDLLRMTVPQTTESEKRIATIQKAAERAAGLTRQLLLFSRNQNIDPVPLSVNQLMQQFATRLRRMVDDAVEVKTRLANRLPNARIDQVRLGQALMNIALNARDAMAEGGGIEIRTIIEEFTPVNAPQSIPREFIKISIADTGEGISNANLHKIFDPFFTTKEVGKGAGLGLSEAYGIIKSHNGYISVETELGRGTTFHVYLEPIDEPAVYEIDVEDGTPAPRNETVLIVDDEVMIRESLRDSLLFLGYNVSVAKGGPDAIRIVRDNRNIQIAIVDFAMPEMNGIETIDAIRKIDHNIKVVLSSGYAERDKLIDKDYEIAGFLPKPYHIDDLADILQAVAN